MPNTPQCSLSSPLILMLRPPACARSAGKAGLLRLSFRMPEAVSIMPHLAIRRKRRWWIVPAVLLLLLAMPPPERSAAPPVVWHELHSPAGADAVLAGAAEVRLPVP